MAFHIFPFPAVAVLLYLIMIIPLLLTMADRPDPCDIFSGCCSENNYGPGPLNLTPLAGGFDVIKENKPAFVYQCIKGNFTSVRWQKKVNGSFIDFPWGESADRFSFTSDHNQTLVINNAKRSDAGYYRCLSSNMTDHNEGIFELRINCRETSFTFKFKPEPVQQVELHQRKTLRCAAYSKCNKSATLYWKWHPDDPEKSDVMITNNTLKNVAVVCDTGDMSGNDCSLQIYSVEKEHTEGQFVCQAEYHKKITAPVKFVLQDTEWLVGLIVGFLSVIAVICVIFFIKAKYGHKLLFKFQTLPDRGDFDHDVTIVRGEDHELLVREILEPQLIKFGYDVNLDFAQQGRPETLEQAIAIVTSYCVVLAFSNHEMQDLSTNFLSQLLMQKSVKTVIFIRFCDAHISNDVWRRENLSEFKVLDWPTDVPSDSMAANKSKKLEKFLYKLRSNLPSADKSRQVSFSQRRNGSVRQNGVSSTGSNQPLLASGHSDQAGSINATSNDYVQIDGSNTEQVDEDDESGFTSPQEQDCTSPLAQGLASPQACDSSKCTLMDCASSSSAMSDQFHFSDHTPSTSTSFSSSSPLIAAEGQTNATHHQRHPTSFIQCKGNLGGHNGCHGNLIDFRGIEVPHILHGSTTDAAYGYETNSADGRVNRLGRIADSGAERRFETQESGYHSLPSPVNPSPVQSSHMMPSQQQPMTALLREGENSP